MIQNFEQPALALKNRVCPKTFHCIEIFFIFQTFEQLVPALKTVCPDFFKPGRLPPPASYATDQKRFCPQESFVFCKML